jgi:hypothetical protein
MSLSNTGEYLWAEVEVPCRVFDSLCLLFARWFLALDRCSLALWVVFIRIAKERCEVSDGFVGWSTLLSLSSSDGSSLSSSVTLSLHELQHCLQ